MKFLFSHHWHILSNFREKRLIYFEAPHTDEAQSNAEKIAGEGEKMESFDKESAKLIQEFNRAIDTSKMNREEAVQLQKDVIEWVSDGFLDNNESMQLRDVVNQLQNDLVETIESREKAAQTVESEYKKPSLKNDTVKLFTYFVKTDGKNFKIRPTDFSRLASRKARGKFPPDLQKRLDKDDASFIQNANNPTTNLIASLKEDPELKNLGSWLSGQFDEHVDQLSQMGITNRITELTPAEAVKFTQYLMIIKFGNRINNKYAPHEGDDMSILALSTQKNTIVCRNSAQIFQGYILALQKLQARTGKKNTPLESIYVKSTAAGLSHRAGNAPGVEKDHVWNEIYVRRGTEISTMHIDPNWGVQPKKNGKKRNFDQTSRRIMYTASQMLDSQNLADTTANSIKEFMQKFNKNDSIQLTPQAADRLTFRMHSLYFAEDSVDFEKLESILFEFRRRLDTSKKTGVDMKKSIEELYGARELIKAISLPEYDLSHKEMNLNQQIFRLSLINKGMQIFLQIYDTGKGSVNEEKFQKDYAMTKEGIKPYLEELQYKFKTTDMSLLNKNPNTKKIINHLNAQFKRYDRINEKRDLFAAKANKVDSKA